jgi:uncharacterized protein (DUF488 family)
LKHGAAVSGIVSAVVPTPSESISHPCYTIGHSNRPIDEFVDLLRAANVRFVADVRKMPRSRAHPQFNADALAGRLALEGVGYAHFPGLGGLRSRSPQVSRDVNGLWKNRSFHNYADYALGQPFRDALAQLRARNETAACAVMCAEVLWWRCHRRIIADYLIAAGENVLHILGPHQIEPARLTPGAEPRPDGTVLYPAR